MVIPLHSLEKGAESLLGKTRTAFGCNHILHTQTSPTLAFSLQARKPNCSHVEHL